jgi:hypothetical protein
MSTLNIEKPSTLVVKTARSRTTQKEASGPGFGAVLRGGANVVLRGVETAAGVVGGPLMSGAVRTAREGIGLQGGGTGHGADGSDPSDNGTFDEVRALQEQAQAFNLQYLAIQEEVQQENRRFTTLSNVAKAMHDTNKAVLQNVRS